MDKKHIEKYHFLKGEPKKRQFEIFDLAEYQQKYATGSAQPHAHSFYQIIWFKNNTGTHYIDFEGYDINEDRIFFVAKNQVHYFENRSDYSGYLIHFNESFILSNETDINFFLTYHIFSNREEPYFQIPKRLKTQLVGYLDQMKEELNHSEEFGNTTIISNLLKSLLLVIEREKRKNIDPANLTHQQNTPYLTFRDLLENNFHKQWSVANYANEMAISTKTLNTLIKKQSGNTASQSITDRTISEAKRKLTHTNAYINDVAFELGFQDPYYFIKYFKKHVNYTPSEFRKFIS